MPTSLYLALLLTEPDATDTGSTIDEVTAPDYARLPYGPASNAYWESTQGGVSGVSVGISGQTRNNTEIVFPGAMTYWGVIVGIAIVDAVMAGNVIFYGKLSVSMEIDETDVFKLNAEDFKITLV